MDKRVVIPKTWRSEWVLSLFFVVTSFASIYVSKKFPWTVVTGEIITIGEKTIFLTLPMAWLVPCFAMLMLLYRIYDVQFSVDRRGIQSRVGILGFSQRIVRVRYEDVRSVEVDQTLIERFLDIGNLAVGTAATSGIEIYFEGVGAPAEVQHMIQAERDRRQTLATDSPAERLAQNTD